jgi:LmbE family N-acetylglucosaminyl deacetylase
MTRQLQEQLRAWVSGDDCSHVAIVAAHPDDETVGLGARLQQLSNAAYVIASDGAPYNPSDASRVGFSRREDYACARRQELQNVLSLCGVSAEHVFTMGFADQQLSFNMSPLVRQFISIFAAMDVKCVITHPYEGGHPDHDAVAFAVNAACRILRKSRRAETCIIEMTSYHLSNGRIETGAFLPQPGFEPIVFRLSKEERTWKQRLLDCYRTQKDTLAMFRCETESFRFAPEYNFLDPPHCRPLLYDAYDWGVNSAGWQELARAAITDLENT